MLIFIAQSASTAQGHLRASAQPEHYLLNAYSPITNRSGSHQGFCTAARTILLNAYSPVTNRSG